MTATARTGWIRVSRKVRCPICDHPDWCCISAAGDAAWCMRVKSPISKSTDIGIGYLHRLNGQLKRRLPPVRHVSVPVRTARDWRRLVEEHYERAGYERWRLAERLGVSVESLERLQVGAGINGRGEPYTTWPERAPAGTVCGVVVRYNDGKAMIRGSHHGLYFTSDWRNGDGPLLIVEGGSDVAACLTMGFQAIGRPSATGGLRLLAKMLRRYEGRVVIVAENDEKPDAKCGCPSYNCCLQCWPGLHGAQVTFERLGDEFVNRASIVRPPDGAKDIRDCLKRREWTKLMRERVLAEVTR